MTTTTATVLFCDVVGSTRHRARLGEIAADRFFRDHERLLREVVREHNGRVVKGAGDGVMAVFNAASDAVLAAVGLHQAVQRETPEIQIRVGAAAGDVSWEGDDCFGMTVVVAARLESTADPGGVLVSSVTRLLAGDRAGVEYRPVGSLDLKGVPEPVETLSVVWHVAATAPTTWRFPATLPALARHPFVGRANETAALEAAWADVSAGGYRVVMLGGEAGAGKTRLATEFARKCHAEGALVLCGLCDSELSLAYQPWVMALDELIGQLPESVLEGLRTELAQLQVLLPQIGKTVSALPVTERLDPEAERHRLFGATSRLLEGASELAPVLIVVDDLHWAGNQTLDLFKFLVRARRIERCLIVSTFRDTDDEVSGAFASALAECRRNETVERIKVGGIGSEDVFELLTALDARGDLRARAEAIAARTGGNAFLVSELSLHGEESDGEVPGGVLDVVEGRLLRMDDSARRLASIMAVGGRVELPVLIDVARSAGLDLGDALHGLLRADLIQELGGPVPAYQFSHALIREAVVSKLSIFDRAQLHHLLAEAIELVHETDRRPVLPELARHFAAAAPIAGWNKAAYYGRRAAVQARRTAAYEEAIEVIRAALGVTPSGTEERALLLIEAVDLLERCGRNAEAVVLAEEADDVAEEIDHLALRARACIELERAAHLANGSLGRSIPRLRRVLGRTDDLEPPLRSQVMASLGRACWLNGIPDGTTLIEEALGDARGLGDPTTISHALEMACVAERDPKTALGHARELEAVTSESGNIFQSMWAMTRQTDALLTLGRMAEAEQVLDRLREGSQRYHFTNYRFLSLLFSHTLALAAGAFDQAESATESANTAEQDEFTGVDAAGTYGLQMFMIRRAQGRLEEMRPVLRLLAQSANHEGIWRPGLVLAYAELGMLDEAQSGFDAIVSEWSGLARDTLWPLTLFFLAETAWKLERGDAADLLLAELEPYAGLTIRAGYTTNGGPADRCRGVLAELAGRHALADECIASARVLASASGSPIWLAQVEISWSWILGRRGDSARAADHRDRALALAQQFGIGSILMSPTGIPTVGDRAAVVVPDGLSPREVEVLGELALGHTNRRIADRLHISVNTAANHVQAILRKTSCENRTEAAAYAFQHGLVKPDETD